MPAAASASASWSISAARVSYSPVMMSVAGSASAKFLSYSGEAMGSVRRDASNRSTSSFTETLDRLRDFRVGFGRRPIGAGNVGNRERGYQRARAKDAAGVRELAHVLSASLPPAL